MMVRRLFISQKETNDWPLFWPEQRILQNDNGEVHLFELEELDF